MPRYPAIEKGVDQRNDLVGLVLQGEVSGVDEMELDVGEVTLVRMRPVGGT